MARVPAVHAVVGAGDGACQIGETAASQMVKACELEPAGAAGAGAGAGGEGGGGGGAAAGAGAAAARVAAAGAAAAAAAATARAARTIARAIVVVLPVPVAELLGFRGVAEVWLVPCGYSVVLIRLYLQQVFQ